MARTHVVLSDDLMASIDRLVGERGRSKFLELAAREKLERLELEQALRETSGILEAAQYPEWRDRETTARWVAETRAMKALDPLSSGYHRSHCAPKG